MFTAKENRKINANDHIYSAAIMTLSFGSSNHKQLSMFKMSAFSVDTGNSDVLTHG